MLWTVGLISYVGVTTSLPTMVQLNGADRWIMHLTGWTGVGLVAGESLRSLKDFRPVLRAVAWGGSVMGLVAILQYWAEIDLSGTLRELPGFTINADTLGILSRSSLNRVAGTALHPIELGVVAASLLPLLIFNALQDKARSRWLPVALVGACVPISVSRSAIVALVISMTVLVVCLAPRTRLYALGFTGLGPGGHGRRGHVRLPRLRHVLGGYAPTVGMIGACWRLASSETE